LSNVLEDSELDHYVEAIEAATSRAEVIDLVERIWVDGYSACEEEYFAYDDSINDEDDDIDVCTCCVDDDDSEVGH
jgi:hypothetical protein